MALMDKALASKIAKLAAGAAEKGHWQVHATALRAGSPDAGPDAHINFIGALHECSYLRNVLEPYWAAWRNEAFLGRCAERLKTGDFDYWAVAALLGGQAAETQSRLTAAGFQRLGVHLYSPYGQNAVHVGVFAHKQRGNALEGLVEIGCDSVSREITQTIRWRAVILDSRDDTPLGLAGAGSGTYFMEARLPRFSWRMQSQKFNLAAADLIDPAGSAFA